MATSISAVLLLAGTAARVDEQTEPSGSATLAAQPLTQHHLALPPAVHRAAPYVVVARPPIARRPELPGGGRRVFEGDRLLVAWYGAAERGSIGVTETTSPAQMRERTMRAVRPYRALGQRVRPVFDLVVSNADRFPGPDGDYSHDLPRAVVRRYLAEAHRDHAILMLDVQPGRSPFQVVVRRWAWVLRDPSAGLALDNEWRMGPHQVPGRVVGSTRASEVNATTAWLARLVRRHDLPQKLLVLHQFTTGMLPGVERIRTRPELAMVQHADGVGTRSQKLWSLAAIARPQQFHEGMKVFYDVDPHHFSPAQVLAVRPVLRFVSYQ